MQMLRRVGLSMLALGSTANLTAYAVSTARHASFELISAQEYQAEIAQRASAGGTPLLIPRAADPNAPTITVIKPDRHAPIQPPVDIDVRFKAAAGATVDIASLKITYGFLRLDITRRILQAPGVQVSAAGLRASGARLPSGSHKLVIQLSDDVGRTARQPLEFTVR